MPEHDLEKRLNKALACLDFVTGVLARADGDLEESEREGLVYILSDILEVFEEAKTFILAQRVST